MENKFAKIMAFREPFGMHFIIEQMDKSDILTKVFSDAKKEINLVIQVSV